MDENDAARRIAAMDQARAGVGDLSRLTAEFYRECREHGLPKRLTYLLTRDFAGRLMGGGVSE